MLKCHVILSYIISSNRKHTFQYNTTWLQFDQSDCFTLVRFNQWRSSIVMWFGLSWYSIYTVRSVHLRTLLISHNYIFSFSKLIKDNVSGHDIDKRRTQSHVLNVSWVAKFALASCCTILRRCSARANWCMFCTSSNSSALYIFILQSPNSYFFCDEQIYTKVLLQFARD